MEPHTPYVRFKQVRKSYDHKQYVVKDFNLEINKGEFVTLLGPSGSGKTTCLMMLAGFETPSSGNILIDGRAIDHIPPYKRNIGVVFQHYALFPHMSVAENLAYPLQVRKLSKAVIQQQVAEALQLVALDDLQQRYPGQLSGGQKQRVALARSLIFKPDIVLMDEPLGALDKNLREQMQLEIKRLHEALGFTTIYVTHDQTEALTMSDRIAVFNDGIVQQCAAPDVLYEQPANAFVADFIGDNNRLPAELIAQQGDCAVVVLSDGSQLRARNINSPTPGQACSITLRPEKIYFGASYQADSNNLSVTFKTHLYVGDGIRYFFQLACGGEVMVKALNDQLAPQFSAGEQVVLHWSYQSSLVLDHDPPH